MLQVAQIGHSFGHIQRYKDPCYRLSGEENAFLNTMNPVPNSREVSRSLGQREGVTFGLHSHLNSKRAPSKL